MRTVKNNFNMIFWLFFSSIFLDYINLNIVYYAIYYIILVAFFSNIIRILLKKKTDVLYDKMILIFYLSFLIYSLTISLLEYKSIGNTPIFKMSSIYLLAVILLTKLKTLKQQDYILNFYKQFVFFMNILTVANIYEIYSKKSIFAGLISSAASNAGSWQLYAFGSDQFRTFSVFEHPIVYGLFLVILFWCNSFIIKTSFLKYILQINVIINLYFTQSRSAWGAFITTLILYIIKLIAVKLKERRISIKFTYKKISISLFILSIFTFIIGFFYNATIIDIYNKIYNRLLIATSNSYGDMARLQRLGTDEAVGNFMTTHGIVNFLFGNGFRAADQFMHNTIIAIPNFNTTDNQYLSFFYDFGLIGLMLYILLIVLSIIKFFKIDMLNINNISILIFISISIDMFFFESFGWTDVFLFLIIIMTYMCVKREE